MKPVPPLAGITVATTTTPQRIRLRARTIDPPACVHIAPHQRHRRTHQHAGMPRDPGAAWSTPIRLTTPEHTRA